MDELLNQLHAYGLIIDGSPRLDSGIVRCKTEDNPHKKNGWYIGFTKYLNGKDYIICKYGDWSRDTEGHTYKSWQGNSKLSHDDLEQIRQGPAGNAEKNPVIPKAHTIPPQNTRHNFKKNYSIHLSSRSIHYSVCLAEVMLNII